MGDQDQDHIVEMEIIISLVLFGLLANIRFWLVHSFFLPSLFNNGLQIVMIRFDSTSIIMIILVALIFLLVTSSSIVSR